MQTVINPRINNRRTRTVFRLLCIACTAAIILFIFLNSSQTGELSGWKSKYVMELVNRFLAWTGSGARLTEYFIRKLAHFLEYALLGFSLLLTLRSFTPKIPPHLSWPLLAGLVTAVVDEWIQLHVPERSGQVTDVLLDFGGVSFGVLAGIAATLIITACANAAHHKKQRAAEESESQQD